MSQIFISHVEEDESIALEIAHGLEAADYSTWYYERDSLPGLSYLDQIDEAIEQCQAVVVIISLASLSSWQVDKEVERAHESGKHFVPVLRGVKHIEFQTRKRGWRMAMGVSTSISVPADGASTIVPRIVAGLGRLLVNSEEPVSSPPVNGQTVTQDVSFSEPPDHSVETGEARPLQSEAVAQQSPIDATSTVSDVDTTDSAQIESARRHAVDVSISSEGVAAPADRTIPRIAAPSRRINTRAAMMVLAVVILLGLWLAFPGGVAAMAMILLVVLVFLGFALYGISKLKSRELVTNSNQAAQSKKIDSTPSVTGTTWAWSDKAEVAFKPNGIVQYKGTSSGTGVGSWEQNGNSVKFVLNDARSCEVVISPDGNEMNGTVRGFSDQPVYSTHLKKTH